MRTNDQLEKAAIDVAYEFKSWRQAWNRVEGRQKHAGIPFQPIPSASRSNTPLNDWSLGHNDAANLWPVSDRIQPSSLSDDSFLDVEALLIHFRVLIEFFYPTESVRSNTVLAEDYVNGGASQTPPEWAKQYRKRCHQLLAHLTYDRTDYRQKDAHHWPDLEEKVLLMEETIAVFLKALSPERREWFRL